MECLQIVTLGKVDHRAVAVLCFEVTAKNRLFHTKEQRSGLRNSSYLYPLSAHSLDTDISLVKLGFLLKPNGNSMYHLI
jgi:hypothetical protein